MTTEALDPNEKLQADISAFFQLHADAIANLPDVVLQPLTAEQATELHPTMLTLDRELGSMSQRAFNQDMDNLRQGLEALHAFVGRAVNAVQKIMQGSTTQDDQSQIFFLKDAFKLANGLMNSELNNLS